jgi:hypothetical protein
VCECVCVVDVFGALIASILVFRCVCVVLGVVWCGSVVVW